MATLEKCLSCFPILDNLMAYLSATDSAIILGVMGLLYGPSKSAYTKYIHIYKDIPEYASWVQKMLSKGHTLLLVGVDLTAIQHSYNYPLTYWRRHSRSELRSLWLLCLTTKMYKEMLRDSEMLAATNDDGDVVKLPTFSGSYLQCFHWGSGCTNALCHPRPLSLSYNMPLPLPWPDCSTGLMRSHSWFPLARNEGSNILLVYLRNYCTTEAIFDEITNESAPYYSAIMGDDIPFGAPGSLPYMNMRDGTVTVGETVSFRENSFDLPPESDWDGGDWGPESDMDRFKVAFYQRQWGALRGPNPLRYEFRVVEFAGLDPDLHAE